MADQANRRFRTIWISDLHLGTRGCQAERVMDFLRRTECETMYLVGDIIDIWRLKVARYWPQSHNDVVQKLLRRARKGCRMIYVPGNHDDAMRNYLDYEFGRVQVVGDWIHETADGRTLLVIHGDQFDSVVARAPWIGRLGTHANAASQLVNQWFNVGRRRLGYPYWSLSGYLKQKVRHRGDFIKNYETALAAEARRRGVDGVVCGHIHLPGAKVLGDIAYWNIGDWVDNCTALVEHHDGSLELIAWPEPEADIVPITAAARSTA